ncbi:M20 metallopeptidase family protein [Brevibacillus panacihumi]|uniref:Amidohydrolase n=1 Tax=Brevibacillus panacihumi TaxID=497735 RepID=A0A3M8D3S9_9BACL|nr:amidohydrolase [Brevibacillus panacihumi]RNB81845.1 amidohydrolase [Brevibacillus panacihumi]
MLAAMCRELETLYPELVNIRRDLHMYPELSFQEVNTPQKVADYLQNLGLEVRTGVGGRGVIGLLRGGAAEKGGRTIALRADFDALPIQDEKEVPYKSRIPGVMHACGHDLHTASLLGAAHVLSKAREELRGNVVFLHQFGEEKPPGGAKAMIEDGCLDGVDVIYGAHVWPALSVGEVAVTEGYAMAAGDLFEIEIKGRGGHGAQPHMTVDPLVVGCQLVLNLQQIVSRRVNPLEPAVLTVASIHSGQASNVIPDICKLTGTIRCFSPDVRQLLHEQITKITKATCEAADAAGSLVFRKGYDAVWNHPEQVRSVEEAAIRVVGEDKFKRVEPSMTGEDFSAYLQKVPGAFFFVGVGNPEQDAIYPLHHPRFDGDERAMLITGKLFLHLVWKELG